MEYSIQTPTPYARQLASIIVSTADELERAIGLLGNGTSKLKDILPITVEINRLEHEADRVVSQAMGNLFNDGNEVVDILKWRDIYNDMEEYDNTGNIEDHSSDVNEAIEERSEAAITDEMEEE